MDGLLVGGMFLYAFVTFLANFENEFVGKQPEEASRATIPYGPVREA